MTDSQRRKLTFALLSLPAFVITARAWLWTMGIIDHLDGDRALAGVMLSVLNYFAAAFVAFGMNK
jgi:hypothetical protein